VPEFIFYVFFARCSFSSYFCIGVFSHFFQVMIFQVLCFIFAVYLALLLFVFIRSLRSCGIAASSCRQHLQLQTMRHCRSGIAASSIAANLLYSMIMRHCRSGIAASSLPPACGIAAEQIMRHCRSGIAASIYSGIAPPAFTAALPPACIHTAAVPPAYTYILRHCRQQALMHTAHESIPVANSVYQRLLSGWDTFLGHLFLFGATWLASSSSATCVRLVSTWAISLQSFKRKPCMGRYRL